MIPTVDRHVSEAMHRGVVTCPPEMLLPEVAELMATRRIHAVVVFSDGDAGRRWGVLSDLDLVDSIDVLARRTAESAAATPVVMITPDEPLRRAAELMTQYRTTHLIVVDPHTMSPIGVISSLDVARAFASPLR
jgi:CBS domain-containing protein